MFEQELNSILSRLIARSENAYIQYISACKKDECLGVDGKMHGGLFGRRELEAHKYAAEILGRHKALCETATLLRDSIHATPEDK